MKSTEQAWYWLAAGVLAMGLNSTIHNGDAHWAGRIADRVTNELELASGRADRLVEAAQKVVVREQTAACRVTTAWARFQTEIARKRIEFASAEANMARRQALMQRVEAGQEAVMVAQRHSVQARLEFQNVRLRHETAMFTPANAARRISLVCPRVRVSPSALRVSTMTQVNFNGTN
jgi:hypothetical protein